MEARFEEPEKKILFTSLANVEVNPVEVEMFLRNQTDTMDSVKWGCPNNIITFLATCI